ncbi:hypothetical protein [Halostella pelagica]|uniref:hypothetical protein n=1 Tax=Halostella pelagica TaxID=2583824 RepID=UPI0010813E45|nr:hypothetical protein [Halostella pelagica]
MKKLPKIIFLVVVIIVMISSIMISIPPRQQTETGHEVTYYVKQTNDSDIVDYVRFDNLTESEQREFKTGLEQDGVTKESRPEIADYNHIRYKSKYYTIEIAMP